MLPSAGGFNQEVLRLRDCLQSVDFFSSLRREETDKLLALMRKRTYAAGEIVLKQGEFGNCFYLIASGKVSVWNKEGRQIAVRQMGDYFGESALVTNGYRSATVKAEVETDLYMLKAEDFKKILMANPDVAFNISGVVEERKADKKDGKRAAQG